MFSVGANKCRIRSVYDLIPSVQKVYSIRGAPAIIQHKLVVYVYTIEFERFSIALFS